LRMGLGKDELIVEPEFTGNRLELHF
jgi:hypothetical protein